MDWVEVEEESREAADKKAVEIMDVEGVESLEIEQVKVVRKFMGMGGRICKLRVRVKPDAPDEIQPTEIMDNVPADKRDEPEERTDVAITTDPSPAVEEPVAPPSAASNRQTGDEIVTFDSLYRPWITGGPGGIHIPKKGKGYAARLYNPDPLADLEPASNKKEKAPDRKEPQETFTPAVYENAEDSTVSEQAMEKALEFLHEINSPAESEST